MLHRYKVIFYIFDSKTKELEATETMETGPRTKEEFEDRIKQRLNKHKGCCYQVVWKRKEKLTPPERTEG